MDSGNGIIAVVGSCMIDFIVYTPRLPKEGETIHGSKFVTAFGGKGANQCIAAAKLGAESILIARVGDDMWGEKYIDNLRQCNVQTKYVKKTPGYSNGIAQITVSDSGQNQIVIVSGANMQLNADDIQEAANVIINADVVVCQLEVYEGATLKALQVARGMTILNAAPAISNYDERLLTLPTIFCVNETEASIFSKIDIVTISDAEKAIKVLLKKGCKSIILTMGAQGALYASQENSDIIKISSPQVNCVDSTGAGDAFIGALAYLLAKRKDLSIIKAIEIACLVAADSVTRLGTQTSFPGADILKQALKST